MIALTAIGARNKCAIIFLSAGVLNVIRKIRAVCMMRFFTFFLLLKDCQKFDVSSHNWSNDMILNAARQHPQEKRGAVIE